jgi:hypothetical protein
LGVLVVKDPGGAEEEIDVGFGEAGRVFFLMNSSLPFSLSGSFALSLPLTDVDVEVGVDPRRVATPVPDPVSSSSDGFGEAIVFDTLFRFLAAASGTSSSSSSSTGGLGRKGAITTEFVFLAFLRRRLGWEGPVAAAGGGSRAIADEDAIGGSAAGEGRIGLTEEGLERRAASNGCFGAAVDDSASEFC